MFMHIINDLAQYWNRCKRARDGPGLLIYIILIFDNETYFVYLLFEILSKYCTKNKVE